MQLLIDMYIGHYSLFKNDDDGTHLTGIGIVVQQHPRRVQHYSDIPYLYPNYNYCQRWSTTRARSHCGAPVALPASHFSYPKLLQIARDQATMLE
jgi:hypothetical protein